MLCQYHPASIRSHLPDWDLKSVIMENIKTLKWPGFNWSWQQPAKPQPGLALGPGAACPLCPAPAVHAVWAARLQACSQAADLCRGRGDNSGCSSCVLLVIFKWTCNRHPTAPQTHAQKIRLFLKAKWIKNASENIAAVGKMWIPSKKYIIIPKNSLHYTEWVLGNTPWASKGFVTSTKWYQLQSRTP